MSTFYTRYRERRERIRSVLCVGLDPDPDQLPGGYDKTDAGLLQHLEDIIESTADVALAYKPNAAFFESRGAGGWGMLHATIEKIRKAAPEALVILDAKRGDLGNTASHYAKAVFDELNADAVTLNPYMGRESLEPFLERSDRCSFVLCLTSNTGARDLQYHGDPPLFERVARLCHEWNQQTNNLGLVVGATRKGSELQRVRELAPDLPFLVPGVGRQGGDLDSVMEMAGKDVLVNSSRSILFASHKRENLVESARQEAQSLLDSMQKYLS
ncbi:MAG: orotidine-5'-phosphate decarboxylase [Leptospiraceae bacterium]|nr:orotidine-5'-phosphate decarboxylase [Leptospiraceae bacterium]